MLALFLSLVPAFGNVGEAFEGKRAGEYSVNASTWSEYKMEQPLMGTLFTIRLYTPSRELADKACKEAFSEAKRLEQLLSSRDERSELAAFNRVPHGTFFTLSQELADALRVALDYASKTRGAFDPSLGPCVRLWRRAASRKQLPDLASLEAARISSGYSKLVLEGNKAQKTVPGMRIDLGGIGKGMAVDAMGRVLDGAGISVYCISSTSDVLAGDPPPGQEGWRVALDTEGKEMLPLMKRCAVSTSGDMYKRIVVAGTSYSHVTDPATGLGSTRAGSVTVLSHVATEADALSTACSAVGEKASVEILNNFPGVKAIFHETKNAPEPSSGSERDQERMP